MERVEDIFRDCQKGDPVAMSRYYSLYANAIINTSYRITHNREESQEITQESFLKLFNSISKYKDSPQRAFFALRRIAINSSIDYLRKRKIDFTPLNEQITPEDEPEEDLSYSVDKIMRAAASLSASYRLVFSLRAIEGLEFSEIAQILSYKESTVRSNYTRAKQNILKSIK